MNFIKIFDIIYIKKNNLISFILSDKREKGGCLVTYAEQVKEAIDTLVDVCAYHDGCDCANCEANGLCQCKKPLDLLDNNNTNKD